MSQKKTDPDLLFYTKQNVSKVKQYIDVYNDRKQLEKNIANKQYHKQIDIDRFKNVLEKLRLDINDTLSHYYSAKQIKTAISLIDRLDRIFWEQKKDEKLSTENQ